VWNASNSAVFTTTATVTRGQWVRIEWHIIHSATVGFAELKLFNTADSSTATETQTSAANKNFAADCQQAFFGHVGALSDTGFISYQDNIVMNAAAYAGVAIPTNTVAPAVTGTQTVGSTLSCTTGTWTGDATITYTYQWQRGGVNIGSATSSTYVLVDADDATNVRCVVTAANGASAGVTANSNAVAITEPIPTNSVAPAVTGTTAVGDTLTCSTGTWTHQGGTVHTYAYQWKRDGVDISGQTAATHVIVSGDQGKTLTCAVTATNTGGDSTPAVSNGVPIAAAVSSSGNNQALLGYLYTHRGGR